MSESTWLFVIAGIAIVFPVMMVLVNTYFSYESEDLFEPDVDLPSSTWIDNILDFFKISDFVDAMSNIPQPLRGVVYALWIIMLLYVLVKALPFT